MALDIKIEKRTLNFMDDKKEVYVATADRNGVIDTEKMAKVIAKDTGGTSGTDYDDSQLAGGEHDGLARRRSWRAFRYARLVPTIGAEQECRHGGRSRGEACACGVLSQP